MLRRERAPNKGHLANGCCRLLAPIDDVDSKRTDWSLPSFGPVFVVSRECGTLLCQMNEPATPFLLKQTNSVPSREMGFLCYHGIVKVVPWNGQEKSFGTNEGLGDFLRKLTQKDRYKLHPLSTENAQHRLGTTETCRSHNHATVSLVPSEEDALDFISAPRSKHVPLLAVSLRRKVQSNDNYCASSDLDMACIKRQMAGLSIAFRDQSITSELELSSAGMNICFKVDQVVGRKTSDEDFLYIILPSTRITFLPPEVEHASHRPNVDGSLRISNVSQSTAERDAASHATRVLVETAKCLREASGSLVSKAFLLSGPPGVGKTYAIKEACRLCKKDGPTPLISLGSLLGSGESDSPHETSRLLKMHFEIAAKECQRSENCVCFVFIDECDALLSNDTVAGMLASLLDESSGNPGGWERLIVVAATNRLDAVSPFLRRPGRFDQEICVSPPNAQERATILEALITSIAGITPSRDVLEEVARVCVGYVPADLSALVRRVFGIALEEELDDLTADHFRRAMLEVGASSLRGTALNNTGTSWDDIAGNSVAKTALRQAIEWPVTRAKAFTNLGLSRPKGILLYGPPGCAKTTLARAAASASGVAFFSFSPADVFGSSYVGEAEATVRRAFDSARSAAPSILFFDEIDAIIGSDGEASHGMNRSGEGSSAESRVLSTFLNLMDGVDNSPEDGVLVLAATNRPSALDKALLRPGRFDKTIHVPPPDYYGRFAILSMLCKAFGAKNVNIGFLASDQVTGSMTGAEIVGACREAAMQTMTLTSLQSTGLPEPLTQIDLEKSLRSVKPLLSSSSYCYDFG